MGNVEVKFLRWLAFVGDVPCTGFFDGLRGVFTCSVKRLVYTLRKKRNTLKYNQRQPVIIAITTLNFTNKSKQLVKKQIYMVS